MQKKETSYVVIDAGNTRLKIAVFNHDECLSVDAINYNDEKFWEKLALCKNGKLIFSSVLETSFEQKLIDFLSPDVVLSYLTPLPISLKNYKTPETLGMDRVANAVAGAHFAQEKTALVIDMGTCVKYDLIDATKNYLGGIISPGLNMRFNALHTFTGKLPLIEQVEPEKLIGDSTHTSMSSGVINGLQAEIKGLINQFEFQFENLTIFLTGGDLKIFDKGLKNTIFVHENLTLWGLYLILKHNAT